MKIKIKEVDNGFRLQIEAPPPVRFGASIYIDMVFTEVRPMNNFIWNQIVEVYDKEHKTKELSESQGD